MIGVPASDTPPHADCEDVERWERLSGDVRSQRLIAQRSNSIVSGYSDDDVATRYWDIRQSAEHGPFIRAVENGNRPPVPTAPHVLVVPGAFHCHHKGTGADGKRVLAAADRLGWTAEVLPVGSLSPMADNARILIDHLRESKCDRHVIVSLSKGSADVATALTLPTASEATARVTGWVSLSGLVLGTPLVNWLQSQWWRMPGVHLLLWWMGLRFSAVEELRHGPRGRLHAGPTVPAHWRVIHVVGFPCRKHLRHPWAVRGHRRLLPLGPNDGGGILLSDTDRLPGSVYPVWGADHYLNPEWDFTSTLDTLLCHAAASHPAANAVPATRSTK